MLVYELSNLVPWTRNACGDRPRATREELVGTGGARLTLANTGGINVISIFVDGVQMDIDTLEVEISDLVFEAGTEPPADSDVVVNYALTRYTDDEIKEFIVDAAIGVAADLPAHYPVNRDTATITLPDDLLDDSGQQPDMMLQQLIVYKAGLEVFADKGNQAADDAIMIRDGDTTIDTGKTASNSEAALKRLTNRYDTTLLRAKHQRLNGVGGCR